MFAYICCYCTQGKSPATCEERPHPFIKCYLTLAMQVPCIYGKYITSLWPLTPRRQVGAEPLVAIMVFHVQCNIIFTWKLYSFSNFYQKQTALENDVCFSAIISSMLMVKWIKNAIALRNKCRFREPMEDVRGVYFVTVFHAGIKAAFSLFEVYRRERTSWGYLQNIRTPVSGQKEYDCDILDVHYT